MYIQSFNLIMVSMYTHLQTVFCVCAKLKVDLIDKSARIRRK